jgi:hypothetical protein
MSEQAKPGIVSNIIKRLIWPLTIIVIVILFRTQLSLLIKGTERIKTPIGELEFNIETEQASGVAATPSPVLSMNFKNTEIGKEICIAKAKEALYASGFSGVEWKENGLVWGFYESYIGSVVCRYENNVTVFVVSGPEMVTAKKKRYELESMFERGETE